MSIVVGIGLALGGYTLGFLAAGLLSRGVVQDLRRLLTMLLEHPDDENVRGLIRSTLYPEDSDGCLIDLLAKLDWFETLGVLLRIFTPSHKLVIDRNAGWSGQQVEDLLKSYGVRIWGRGFTRNTLHFRVKRNQAGWAEYLLFRCGIPVLSKLVYQRNATYQPVTAARGQRGRTQQKRGVLAELAELFS